MILLGTNIFDIMVKRWTNYSHVLSTCALKFAAMLRYKLSNQQQSESLNFLPLIDLFLFLKGGRSIVGALKVSVSC